MNAMIIAHSSNNLLIAQDEFNMNFMKRLIYDNPKTISRYNNLNIVFLKSFAINNNLLNMENIDGVYLPKGTTSITGILFSFNSGIFNLTIQPEQRIYKRILTKNLPDKQGTFRYLNDYESNEKHLSNNHFKNTGVTIKINKLRAGYGNWNLWWGPGIHNSLILSNNSQGFRHFFISYKTNQLFNKSIQLKYKYLSSENFKNIIGNNFSHIYSMVELNIKNMQLGFNFNYLKGGYENYSGKPYSLSFANLNNKAITAKKSAYYLMYNNKKTGLKIFYEFGFPNRLGFEKSKN